MLRARPAPGDPGRRGGAGAVRHGPAQQGRAAAARRRGRLSAVAAGRAAHAGPATRRQARRSPVRPIPRRRRRLWSSRSAPTPTWAGWPTFASTRAPCGAARRCSTPANGKRERIGRLVRMHADRREEVDEIRAGDIGAVLGLKATTTGETLCGAGAAGGPGADQLSRAGHRAGHRAAHQGRPGQAVGWRCSA